MSLRLKLIDYAVLPEALQFKLMYRFRPDWFPSLIAILLVAGMVRLGFWQYHKAEQKQALQSAYDARLTEAPVAVPDSIADIEDWRYRRIRAKGHYETAYQILLDNQVENGAAGYHVITPFRAEGSKGLLLVDRGWIPMGDRSRLPKIDTPAGSLEVTGFAWVPSTKFYELSPPAGGAWQPLWQNMDMERYGKAVRTPVLPFVLRLDAGSPADGFVRHWVMPAERIEMHLGYAWQWWGFSATLIVIWIFVNFKKEAS